MEKVDIEVLKEELKQKLENVEQEAVVITDTNYMDDVGSIAIDNRNGKMKREYSKDEEGEVLQEFDETKDAEKRRQLWNKVKKIREARIVKEIKEAKKQEVKKEFMAEIESKQKEVQAQIAEIEEKIARVEEKRKAQLSQSEIHKQITGIKGIDAKVYRAAEESRKDYEKKASSSLKLIKKLRKEQVEWQENWNKLDSVLAELDGRAQIAKEQQEQENEMWEAYRKQKREEEEQKLTEIDRAFIDKNRREMQEEYIAGVTAKKEVQEYDAQLGDRKDNPEVKPEQKSAPTLKVEQKTAPAPRAEQKPAPAPRTEQKTAPAPKAEQKPAPAPRTEQKPVPTPTPEQKTVQNQQYKITQVRFYIDNEGEPVYEVTLLNAEDKQKREILRGWENVQPITSQEVKELEAKSITKAGKYYDSNIAWLLEDVDKEYGTNGLKQYNEIMQTKFMQNRPTQQLDIDYDFRNLYNKPKEKEDRASLKYIKKIAKENASIGIASYQKGLNFFQRLWRRITTQSLPKQETPFVEENDFTKAEENEPIKEEEVLLEREEEQPEKAEDAKQKILAMYEQLYDSPGFDRIMFINDVCSVNPNLTIEEVNDFLPKANPFKEEIKRAAKVEIPEQVNQSEESQPIPQSTLIHGQTLEERRQKGIEIQKRAAELRKQAGKQSKEVENKSEGKEPFDD